MPSSIPFEEQFFVEKNRNNKYEWLVFCLAVFLLLIHGIFFHWIPKYLRGKRTNLSLKHTSYFKFIRIWDLWTSCCSFKFRQNTYYYQPSIALLGAAYFAISGVFCFVETKDLNYQVHNYIIAKRILRVAVGNLPTIMVMITKNDLVSGITGLLHDRLTFIHKWVARTMWILITIHMVMTIQYWLSIQFKVMISIPPQIFGMIAYGFFCILTWGSLKFIRSWAFDFFLVKHRISNFIMLLMMFFHNPANKAVVLISVHGLVLDRVVSRVFTYIHKFKSPTKGLSEFEILDSDTISVTIPIRDISFEYPQKWYNRLLPKCRVWKAGQHIYLNVGKVKFFQYHPFTICSLSESGDMKLLIRKKRGLPSY